MKILFITARFPYPTVKGDQVVVYHRLRLLSQKHEITLVSLYQNDVDLKHIDKLKPFCKKIIVVKLSKLASITNIVLYGMLSNVPLQVLYYRTENFKKRLSELLDIEEFDIIHTYLLRMAEYVKTLNKPKIIDLIDSMQLNFEQRVSAKKFPSKILFKEELRRLKIYENDVVDNYNKVIVVSSKDQAYISSRSVVEINLGIDVNIFKRDSELPNNKTIIFSGGMDYFPNENAALWFLKNCFNVIRENVPEVKFIIAGNKPSAKIKSFHDGISIIVTGYVDSIVDELNKAQIEIAPMQAASGMQFKVLESMACRLPVVTTKLGLGIISATHNENIIVADTPKEFTDACVKLLNDYRLSLKIGERAKELVCQKYSWESNTNKLEEVYNSLVNK